MDVGSVILAGGKGSRMGGADKAFVNLAGKPLIAHVLARLTPQVADLVTSANGDLSRFRSLGLPAVADSIGGFAGPLAGLLAGLEWHAEYRPDIPYVACVPTDTPFFPSDLVARLLAEAEREQRPVVARSQSGAHPVIGLWPVATAHALRDALDAGIRKVGAWTELQATAEVAFPATEIGGKTVDPFFNINRPADLAMAETLLRARTP